MWRAVDFALCEFREAKKCGFRDMCGELFHSEISTLTQVLTQDKKSRGGLGAQSSTEKQPNSDKTAPVVRNITAFSPRHIFGTKRPRVRISALRPT